jgi:dCMP deaminase
MIAPHRTKYHDLYWTMAYAAAQQSAASRRKVGAVVVTGTGMISIGWNGMPAGLTNVCDDGVTTDPRVIHAERNAIDKMTRQGVSTDGAIMFTTLSPCLECAKSLCTLGFDTIYYDDVYRDLSGVDFLKEMGTPIIRRPTGGYRVQSWRDHPSVDLGLSA